MALNSSPRMVYLSLVFKRLSAFEKDKFPRNKVTHERRYCLEPLKTTFVHDKVGVNTSWLLEVK